MALRELLTPGARWTLVGGKGGVGKTTTAAALALELAEAGSPVLLLSVDPAHSLGDALGVRLGPEPEPVEGVPGLRAFELDALRERDRFLASRRGAVQRVIERGTMLDDEDAAELTGLAVPGLDELAALFRLLELTGAAETRVVVDTAPTGHTLRLLDLPRQARAWLAALEAMEAKHRAVAEALAGGYGEDEVTRFLDGLNEQLAALEALLTDPARTRFVLVTTQEPVVLAETRRLHAALEARGVAVGGVVVNRSHPAVEAAATGRGMVFVPPLPHEPQGIAGLRRFARSAAAAPTAAPAGDGAGEAAALRVGEPFVPPPDRGLYLVAGKGGVGKTTAAAALACRLAGAEARRVLLLSTDPAGSLGEVLGVPVGAEPVAVAVRGAGELWARQLDAERAWTAYRARFREQAARLFDALLPGAAADRQVLERLIDLAPPGLDELTALLEVVDLEGAGDLALVLDPAPTGHFLRFLEMPEVVLEWTHAVLRLLLKYRGVVHPGELAEHLLRLARTVRGLHERLRDPHHAWVLVVALPEALSVPETRRLLARLREAGVRPDALLVNRLLGGAGDLQAPRRAHARALLDAAEGLPATAAPERPAGPTTPAELERFLGDWRQLSSL